MGGVWIFSGTDVIINMAKCQTRLKEHRRFGNITLLQCGRKPLEYASQMKARARMTGSTRMHEVIVQTKLKLTLSPSDRTVPCWKMIFIQAAYVACLPHYINANPALGYHKYCDP